MAEYPAMPVWTDAYLADTRHLSTVEHGAYFLLLMEAWRRPTCSLPDDDRMLARLAGLSMDEWSEIRDVIMAFWKLDGRSKTWSQKRQTKERDFVDNKSRSQRDRATKRWNNTKKGDATAMPEVCPDDAPTPTPTPIDVEDKSSPSAGDQIPVETKPAGNGKSYAFEGRVIRLNQRDFDQWAQTYSAIPDLRAELAALDAWFTGPEITDAKRKSWFNAVPGMLSRKHQDMIERRRNIGVVAGRNGDVDFTAIRTRFPRTSSGVKS